EVSANFFNFFAKPKTLRFYELSCSAGFTPLLYHLPPPVKADARSSPPYNPPGEKTSTGLPIPVPAASTGQQDGSCRSSGYKRNPACPQSSNSRDEIAPAEHL